jgi:hypothetical protein
MVAEGDVAWEQLVEEVSAFMGWSEEAAAHVEGVFAS